MTVMECQRVLGRALVAAGHEAYSKACSYEASARGFRRKPDLWAIACQQSQSAMADCRILAKACMAVACVEVRP